MTGGDGKRVPGWRRWTEDVPGASPPGPQRCGRGLNIVGVTKCCGRGLRVCGRGLGSIPYSGSKLKFPCNSLRPFRREETRACEVIS